MMYQLQHLLPSRLSLIPPLVRQQRQVTAALDAAGRVPLALTMPHERDSLASAQPGQRERGLVLPVAFRVEGVMSRPDVVVCFAVTQRLRYM